MRAQRVTTNLRVPDLAAAREFYADYLGLDTEEFNLGWVARHTNTETGAHVQLVTGDATAPEDSVATVAVDDLDEAYAEAQRRGYEVVHAMTVEPWGVRRFFVRAPDGNVLNVVQHRHGDER